MSKEASAVRHNTRAGAESRELQTGKRSISAPRLTEDAAAMAAQQQLAAIVESSNDAIISKDLKSIVTSWNKAAEHMFGYAAQDIIGKPITLLIPKDKQGEEPEILSRIKRGERVAHFETVRQRKDGSRFDVSLTVSPVKDAQGRITGASQIARDITEKKEYERFLNAKRQRLELINSAAKTISSDLALEHVVQSVTDLATELSGAKYGAFFYNNTDDKGESLLLYTLSGASRESFEKFGLPRNTAVFEPTFRGRGVVRSADIRKDPRYGKNAPHHGMPEGHLPVVSYLAVPVKSRTGTVLGGLFFGHPEPGIFTKDSELIVRDIAAHAAISIDNAHLHEATRKEVERRRQAEEANELVLNEIQHRMKNTLSTVVAIATQTFRGSQPEEHNAFAARLHALAGAHDALTGGGWKRAYVEEIVERAIEPFGRRRGDRFRISGCEAFLEEEKSVLLSMILHELGTNAVKYGALSNDHGGVHIEWDVIKKKGHDRLQVIWSESGGPEVSQPASTGFGTKLLKRVLQDGEGAAHMDFAPSGLTCTFEMTLD